MKTDLMDIFFLKEELWAWRLEELKKKKTDSWNEDDMKEALKSLKNNKTADPNGMVNELVKPNCAGSNLLESLILLYNGIKMSFHIPRFMILQNITSIFKNKGSRYELEVFLSLLFLRKFWINLFTRIKWKISMKICLTQILVQGKTRT